VFNAVVITDNVKFEFFAEIQLVNFRFPLKRFNLSFCLRTRALP